MNIMDNRFNTSSPFFNGNDPRIQRQRSHDSEKYNGPTTSRRRIDDDHTFHSIRPELFSPASPTENVSIKVEPEAEGSRGQQLLYCKLCNNFQKSELDFDIHLTIIHYKEQLCRRISEPFRCLVCGYTPLSNMPQEDQRDDLLMHFGCTHKFAFEFYRQDTKEIPELSMDENGVEAAAVNISCNLCNSYFESNRVFIRHITNRHFAGQLCRDLPKSEPFICPFIDCGIEKETLQLLMLHYGCEHNISEELYKKSVNETLAMPAPEDRSSPKPQATARFSPSTSSCSPFFASYIKRVVTKRSPIEIAPLPIPPKPQVEKARVFHPPPMKAASKVKDEPQHACHLCPANVTKLASVQSLQHHTISTHLFPDLSTSGVCECPVCKTKFKFKNLFTKHFIEDHYHQYMKEKFPSEKLDNVTESKMTSSKDKSKDSSSKSSSKDKSRDSSSKSSSKDKSRDSSSRDKSSHKSSSSSSKDRDKDRHRSDKGKSSSHRSSHHRSSESSKSKSKDDDRRNSSKIKIPESKFLDAQIKTEPGSMSPTDSENQSLDEPPLPTCRIRQTVHSSVPQTMLRPNPLTNNVSARQKLLETWKKDSIDSQKFELDQLREKVIEMEKSHVEALKKKAEEFERWINQKEKALEEKDLQRLAIETRLEEMSVANTEFEMQLNHERQRRTLVESELEEKVESVRQLLSDKKKLEKDLSDANSELTSSQDQVNQITLELQSTKDELELKSTNLEKVEEEVKALKSCFEVSKEEHLNAVERLERNVDTQVKKVDKLNEEKKAKLNQIREMTKKHSDAEKELQNQVAELTKQNKQLTSKLAIQKTTLEKTAKSELKKLERDHGKVEKQLEEYESQLIESNNTIDALETQRNALLDSLERIQNLMEGFETVIKDKNEIIRDHEGKIADLENIMEDSIKKISTLKTLEKEKKDLTKQVKQLQVTLQDWETRQFTNVKLIAGLEREKASLEKKVKDFEENHTGAEEELYEMSTKIRQLEKDVKKTKDTLATTETELAKAKVRLQSKVDEMSSVTSKNAELEHQVRTLEKEVREKGNVSEEVEQLKKTVAHKEAELTHLRTSFNAAKATVNQMKVRTEKAEGQLKILQASNSNFEAEYSAAVSEIETLKKNLKDSQVMLAKKDNQLNQLKESVRRDANSLNTVHAQMSSIGGETLNPANVAQVSKIAANLNSSLQTQIKQENGFFTIKKEPLDLDDVVPEPSSTSENQNLPPSMCVNTDKQIVLNLPDAAAIVDNVKKEYEEPIIPNFEGFDLDDIAAYSDDESEVSSRTVSTESTLNNGTAATNGGPTENSNNLLSATSSHFSSATSSPSSLPGTSNEKTAKKRKAQIPDVTGQLSEFEENALCAICGEYDPPPKPNMPLRSVYTTEWVGCNCSKLRWFHKVCTKQKRFTNQFSCRSVKMKCIKLMLPEAKRPAMNPEPSPSEDDDINMTIIH